MVFNQYFIDLLLLHTYIALVLWNFLILTYLMSSLQMAQINNEY